MRRQSQRRARAARAVMRHMHAHSQSHMSVGTRSPKLTVRVSAPPAKLAAETISLVVIWSTGGDDTMARKTRMNQKITSKAAKMLANAI